MYMYMYMMPFFGHPFDTRKSTCTKVLIPNQTTYTPVVGSLNDVGTGREVGTYYLVVPLLLHRCECALLCLPFPFFS